MNMNILMISPVPIVPTSTGGKVRIWQIASGLARHHRVTLIAPIYGEEHCSNQAGKFPENCRIIYQPIPCNAPRAWQQLRSLSSEWPYHTALRYRSQLAQRVQHYLQIQQPDLIYCHFIQPLPYLETCDRPIVVDQQNVDRIYWTRQVHSQGRHWLQRWFAARNLHKTIRYESARLAQMAAIVSVSEIDRAETQRYAAGIVPHFFVAPNGVDPAQYQPREEPQRANQLVLGFFGAMDLQTNQDAAWILIQEILPTVQQQLPEFTVSVLVIGRKPPCQLLDFARRHPESHTRLTGTVDDVLPYLHQVDILVLPLQDGAGTKLRVLEAMAAGLCIVGTPLALAGLNAIQPGVHAMCASTHEELAVAICALARQPMRRRQMGRAAHAIVTQQYSWQQITDQLAEELTSVFSGGIPR